MKRFISLAMIIIMLFVSSCTRGNDALDENGVVKDETARSEETGGEISANTNDDEQPDKVTSDASARDDKPKQDELSVSDDSKKDSADTEKTTGKNTTASDEKQTGDNNVSSAVIKNDKNATPASDFKYSVANGDGDTVIIEEYIGSDIEVVIPETIDGKPVTMIWACAFFENETLTSVTIPKTVIVICNMAFFECISLETVIFEGAVTEIGEMAFKSCCSLKNLKLPQGLVRIGREAFAYCTALEEITIPSSMYSIGESAFGNCKNLRTVNFADGIESIACESSFIPFTPLETVVIPASVKSIGTYSFSYCNDLKSVYFGGNAPEELGENFRIGGDNPENITIYYKAGTSGWDNAFWKQYKQETY